MRISVILRNMNDTPAKYKLINNTFEGLKNKIKSIMESPKMLGLKSFTKDKVTESIMVAPQVAKLNSIATVKKQALYKRLLNINNWYIKVIGLEEVKMFHDRVLDLQEQLLNTQGKRREISRQLNEVRQRAMDLQAQLQNISKHEQFDQYFALMKQEGDLVKLEKSISSDFQDYDKTERELFTAFTNAIRDSYEKQRAQVEYTKYFGLILGIIASFLTFVYSTIKKYDLKSFIDDKLSKINAVDPTIYYNLLNVNKAIQNDILQQKQYLSSNKVLLKEIQARNDLIIKEQTLFRKKLNEIISKANKQAPVQEDPISPQTLLVLGGLGLLLILIGKSC